MNTVEANSAPRFSTSDNWAIFELLPVAVYVCAPDGRIDLYNRRAVELWGRQPDLSAAEERYCGPHKHLHSDGTYVTNTQCPVAVVLRTGEAIRRLEATVERSDGRRLTCLVNIEALRDTDGAIVGAINCFNDVSESPRAPEQLQTIVDTASESITASDGDGKPLESVDLIEAQNPADAQRFSILDLIVPEHREQWRQYHQRACGGEKLDWEFDAIGVAGSRRHMQTNAASLHLPDGALVQLAVTRDVTERKKYEEALNQNEARTRLIVETALDAVLSIDEKDVITEWNVQAETMFGWKREEAIGRRLCDTLVPVKYRVKHMEGLRHFLTTGEAPLFNRRVEITALRRNGSEIPVELSIVPYRMGETWAFSGFVRDISERKLAEESLRQRRELQLELAHANRVAAMGQLSASIAHEINQPLGAAIANTTAALTWLGAPPPNLDQVRMTLERIRENCNRAGDIIDRIRALNRKAPQRKDSLEINEVIQEVLELTRNELAKSEIFLQTQFASNLPIIQGDRVQLQQVILNLVINAIDALRGMSQGARNLSICTEKTETDGVLVVVRDSGSGFSSDGTEQLFDAFYTTKPNGLGLGLSICRSIIEAHQGLLWATANEPQGAAFQFTVPARSHGEEIGPLAN
jgi:PAS domain S-box-containing protein